jgi:hypothetical protein
MKSFLLSKGQDMHIQTPLLKWARHSKTCESRGRFYRVQMREALTGVGLNCTAAGRDAIARAAPPRAPRKDMLSSCGG